MDVPYYRPDENPTIVPVQLMVTLPSCEGDFDGDGSVDAKDLAIFSTNFGGMDYQ